MRSFELVYWFLKLFLYTFYSGAKSLWDRGLLSGAGQKAECMSVFHVGETMLSLQKASLIPGGKIYFIVFCIHNTTIIVTPDIHPFFLCFGTCFFELQYNVFYCLLFLPYTYYFVGYLR